MGMIMSSCPCGVCFLFMVLGSAVDHLYKRICLNRRAESRKFPALLYSVELDF